MKTDLKDKYENNSFSSTVLETPTQWRNVCVFYNSFLLPDIVGCVDPDECYAYCQSRSGCSNIAYPKLVLGILPSGEISEQ